MVRNHLKRIHPFLRKTMMIAISPIIIDPLHLTNVMVQWKMTINHSTVCCTHHPGSRKNFHLLRDNCCLHRTSLVVNGKYLLDLIMSMEKDRTLLKFNMRIDIMLLARNLRIFGRKFLLYFKEMSH